MQASFQGSQVVSAVYVARIMAEGGFDPWNPFFDFPWQPVFDPLSSVLQQPQLHMTIPSDPNVRYSGSPASCG